MTYIPTSIQRGSPRDRPPPDKDHAAAGSFTIEYFPGSGSCSGRASGGARPQDITGTPRAHGMRVTGRGDRPLRGGAPAPRTICDTSRKRRSEEHTSELKSLMRLSYAVYCLQKKIQHN